MIDDPDIAAAAEPTDQVDGVSAGCSKGSEMARDEVPGMRVGISDRTKQGPCLIPADEESFKRTRNGWSLNAF